MPGAVESLLSLAGLGFDDEPTSTTTAVPAGAATTRSVVTSLGRAETTTTAVADREKEVVTTLTERTTRTTEAGETRSSVIGPVENTAARTSSTSISSLRPTTTTSSSSSSRVTTTSSSSTSAKSTSIAISTSTMTPSQASSSRSMTTSSASNSNSNTLAIPASATAATDGSDDGFKMSSGIIAAIAVVSALVALALALVGFRYYKRRSRRNARRVSGLNAWASHRQSENVGGWNGGDGTWRKAEESGDGVGRWEGEKEMVSPFPLRSPVDQGRPVPGYDSYSGGYPPQPSYPQSHAYGNEYNNAAQPPNPSYGSGHNELPLPPLPVSMHQTPHQGGSGWMPGTPHTFGSMGSNDESFAQDTMGAAVGAPRTDDPLAAAREMGLHDGAEVVVKQGFVRSLDDELVITVGETLILVQAYDDGWSLCEKKTMQDGGMIERGVVPLNCLEAFSGASNAEQSVSAPPAAMVGHVGRPEQASPSSGQEFLSMPSPSKAGMMTRSSTAHSLAVSERSERRSSLFLNAAAAGLWLQSQPPRS